MVEPYKSSVTVSIRIHGGEDGGYLMGSELTNEFSLTLDRHTLEVLCSDVIVPIVEKARDEVTGAMLACIMGRVVSVTHGG